VRDPKSGTLLAEAAQFALLRRLAPSLRHRLIGGLHPINLLAELAARRLAGEPPDPASARDAVARIQAQGRLATATSVATLAWITGEESPSVSLKEGIEESVALLRTDSEMRGTELSSRIGDLDVTVSRRALRTVFTALLVSAVDAVPRPARIEFHASKEDGGSGGGVLVHVETVSLQEGGSPAFAGDGRPLTWDDVQVLARLEGVEVRATTAPPAFHCRFRPYAA
jgi:signal transduction histidine kinase